MDKYTPGNSDLKSIISCEIVIFLVKSAFPFIYTSGSASGSGSRDLTGSTSLQIRMQSIRNHIHVVNTCKQIDHGLQSIEIPPETYIFIFSIQSWLVN